MTQESLSPEGQLRRVAMRTALEGAIVRRRRRKRAVRGGALAALLVVGGWLVWPDALEPPEAPRRNEVADREQPIYKSFDFEVARGDRQAVAQWVVRRGDISKFLASDEEVIELLAEAGHASGLLRVGGQVLLTRPLEDAGEAD